MLPSHSYIMIAQDRLCQYQILNTFLLLTVYGHIFGCKPNESVNLHTVKSSILKKGILISNFHKHKEVGEITITFIHEHNWQYYSSFGSKTISMCGSPSGILLFMKQTWTSSYHSSLPLNVVPSFRALYFLLNADNGRPEINETIIWRTQWNKCHGKQSII